MTSSSSEEEKEEQTTTTTMTTINKCSNCSNTNPDKILIPKDTEWLYCHDCGMWTHLNKEFGKTKTEISSTKQ